MKLLIFLYVFFKKYFSASSSETNSRIRPKFSSGIALKITSGTQGRLPIVQDFFKNKTCMFFKLNTENTLEGPPGITPNTVSQIYQENHVKV